MEARPVLHPSADSLKAFGLGKLDDASSEAVFDHLDTCDRCRQQVAALSGDDFLDRLRQVHNHHSTPAPVQSLAGPVRSPKAGGWPDTKPPVSGKSIQAALAPLSPASPAIPDLPAELVDNPQYEILRELGRGGMGVVYLARNKLMDRLEVLKVMNKSQLERSGSVDRFLREIQSAARLNHRNVVTAFSAVQMGELLAFAMEYVEGEDLGKVVKARGPLPVNVASYYVQQCALGLQAAFEKGMVHRDIKPQNLILSCEGKKHVIKILDFGLAKAKKEKTEELGLTAEGQMLGTPDYIAPEQALDAANADIRADIYSLGCTLYFLLTGVTPFRGKTLFAILQAHQSEQARPVNQVRPEVPAELATVVAKMMAKDPAHRYEKPADVAIALAPFVKGGKPTAPPAAPPKMVKKENTASLSVPPPLPRHVEVKLVPALAVERAPFDLEDLPAPAASRKRKKGRSVLVALALALLVPLAIGFGMAVFRVETPNGTLVVEMDGDVEAKIKGGNLILTGLDGKVRYTLTTKDRSNKLDAGAYTIHVEGADGLALDTPEFVMKKGGVVTVRVTLRPPPTVRQPPPDSPPSPKKGDTITNSIGMKLAYIPAGKFSMGSPKEEVGRRADEGPEHEVEITKPFYMGVYAVTQGEYEKVTGKRPSWFSASGGGRGKVGDIDTTEFPVESVNWYEAREFCDKLSAREKAAGRVYRLPTEAEWEYACRAGTTTPFHFGTSLSSTQANFEGGSPYGGGDKGPSLGRPCKVGSYRPNAWGLYDMHGNVWQWCGDWYDPAYYGVSPNKDPKGGSDKQGVRVMRGGAWYGSSGVSCRAANREHYPPGRGGGTDCFHVGFRVVMVLSGKVADVIQPKASLDPDRKAAEYVLSVGSQVWIGEEYRHIPTAAELPKEPFRLTAVILSRNGKVNDIGLSAFKGCTHVVKLELFETGLVTGLGLSYFKDCKSMEQLHLQDQNRVENADWAYCKDFKKLKIIRLIRTKINDDGLAHFKGCTGMTILHLGVTQVGDAGLVNLRNFKSLTELDLGYTKVTDKGLASLKNCKQLAWLRLKGTKVTAAGVADLKKSLPKCQIDWDDPTKK